MSNLSIVKEDISSRIYTIRGVQVMLDEDLGKLYGVLTKRLNEQVRRNIDRFPNLFCFQLTKEEYVNSKVERKYLPYVFTEQGVAMLSGVLKSEIAVHMSIQIMTAFVSMRRVIQSNNLVFSRLDNLEYKQLETDKKFDKVFDALSSKEEIPDHKIFFDGQVFDAYKFVSDLVRSAKKDIILIDNFIDDTVLDLFTKRKKGVQVTIYTQSLNRLDLRKFNQQYEEIIVKELKNTHDRFLIIDNTATYHFGASIKDLGKKLFAVSKLDVDSLSLLKVLLNFN